MYLISREFVDGLGRKLMTKSEAGTNEAGEPLVTVKGAVLFNARRSAVVVFNPYYSTLSGGLEAKLGYESPEKPGWTGLFHDQDALVSLALGNAQRSGTRYDAMLREVEAFNADGTRRLTVYEPLVTMSYDENDADPASAYADTPMVHFHDGLARLVRVEEVVRLTDDGSPGSLATWATRYNYDPNDQLRFIIDSQGNTREFRYDGLKRKTFVSDPDRGVMNWTYDEASNLIESVDAKNQRITFTYDGANRILTEDYHDEGQSFSANRAFNASFPVGLGNLPDVAWFYDTPVANLDLGDTTAGTARNTRGRLAYTWELSGEEHASYDARGRVEWVVKRIADPLLWTNRVMVPAPEWLVSYKTGSEYDSADRLTRISYPDNDAVRYEYNERGLLSRISGGPTGSILTNLTYWPSDQQQQILFGNGVRTVYAHDARHRLTRLLTVHPATGSELIHFDYGFDSASNLKSIADRRPGAAVPAGDPRRNTQFFSYDDLYRITRVQYSFTIPGEAARNDGQIDYRYDRIGNMLAQTSTIEDQQQGLPVVNLGQMQSGRDADPSNSSEDGQATDPPGPHALTRIDPAGGGSPRQFPYDANGNMLWVDGITNTWDFKDRLVAAENDTMRAEYIYDYTGRRVFKRVFWKHGDPHDLPSTSSANANALAPSIIFGSLPR